ncbi:ARID DNA-binding domain-containing protein [Tanacetum coccineum]
MVHYKHIMQHNWLGDKPVQKWYQSHGSEPWEKPIHKHDQVVHTRRYLQRDTPKRLFPWNSRKKSLSPESKEMLVKKMKEVKVFNASKMSAKTRDHGKKIASTQKEETNKQWCYIWEKEKATDDAIWDEVWYVSSAYKNHMCPTRPLFKKLTYKFKMIEKEEIEKKFIFSYGVGDVTVEAREGNLVIPNVHYTPEVTLNVLSFDLLEEQGYTVKISNNKCNLHYMFDEARTGKAQEESFTEDDGSKDVVTEHNKFLDEYFESIDQKEECSLVNGLEDLKWDRNDIHDYVDEEYISWDSSLYALKVNSFARFLSFLNLIKKDSMVYKHWDIFSKKYVEMLKWFYLVYLNYDMLEEIPPVIGVMEINLLSLHKIVDSLGGYLCVTLGDKWKTIANLQGLTKDDGEAVK